MHDCELSNNSSIQSIMSKAVVECAVCLSNGDTVDKTTTVTDRGNGRELYTELITALSTLKEDVNGVLTEELVKEKQQGRTAQPLKRPSEEDSEGNCL